MADTQNADDISMVTVPAKVMAEIIGVGDRQVRNLAEEGILVRNSHGKYLLLKSVKNYIMNLKIAKAGEKVVSDFDDEELDLDHEKAVHEHYKTMITEIKLALVQGKVHKAEDVERVITNMFENFKSKMNAIPSKLAQKLQGKKRVEIQQILKHDIDAALLELSEYNPVDYYSDEHIDIEGYDMYSSEREDYEE